MDIIEQSEPIVVVGIEIRTSNAQAFEDIPRHWQRFFAEGTMERIPNKRSGDIYALYTNFENEGVNNDGVYSFIIGAEVDSAYGIPDGMASAVIANSKRCVFRVPDGQPQKVGEKWMEIWGVADIDNAFVCDYERYGADGRIEILVGVR